MFVRRLVLGMLETNCWLVGDDGAGPIVVIDPAGDGSDAADIVTAAEGRRVGLIVLTHAHFDHLGSAHALVDMTAAPLTIHEVDAPRITSTALNGTGGAFHGFPAAAAPPADRVLRDGERIGVGAMTLEVWLTPGHTAGSISLLATQTGETIQLFAGDTLFAGSVGRTDFPGGDGRALQRSIARLATLPDETIVHPGHGPDTTIGRERRVNPFFPRA